MSVWRREPRRGSVVRLSFVPFRGEARAALESPMGILVRARSRLVRARLSMAGLRGRRRVGEWCDKPGQPSDGWCGRPDGALWCRTDPVGPRLNVIGHFRGASDAEPLVRSSPAQKASKELVSASDGRPRVRPSFAHAIGDAATDQRHLRNANETEHLMIPDSP
jgi:hypothetical protein